MESHPAGDAPPAANPALETPAPTGENALATEETAAGVDTRATLSAIAAAPSGVDPSSPAVRMVTAAPSTEENTPPATSSGPEGTGRSRLGEPDGSATREGATDTDSGPVGASSHAPLDLGRVRAAWKGLLEEGDGVPAGTGLILRPARLTLAGADCIRVNLPPGSPVLDRLSKASSRRPLEAALARRLGRAVRLELLAAEAGEGPPHGGRITAETARQDRLKRLVEEEPLLAAAVQEWDLELID